MLFEKVAVAEICCEGERAIIVLIVAKNLVIIFLLNYICLDKLLPVQEVALQVAPFIIINDANFNELKPVCK